MFYVSSIIASTMLWMFYLLISSRLLIFCVFCAILHLQIFYKRIKIVGLPITILLRTFRTYFILRVSILCLTGGNRLWRNSSVARFERFGDRISAFLNNFGRQSVLKKETNAFFRIVKIVPTGRNKFPS